MIVRDALSDAQARLGQKFDEFDAMNEAKILLCHAMDISRAGLIARMNDILSEAVVFEDMIVARLQYQPISQIIGSREFWGRDFIVTSDVLDPRPDTETLIALALEIGPQKCVLDLGLGSGCILFTLLAEWQNASGVGIDVSDAALEIATQNAHQTGVADRCTLQQGDWCNNVSGKFNLIVSNPPYISADEMRDLQRDVREWEPHLALSPGGDGLDAYRILARDTRRHLAPDGILLLEIGFAQAESVRSILNAENWSDIRVHQDLSGHNRVIEAHLLT